VHLNFILSKYGPAILLATCIWFVCFCSVEELTEKRENSFVDVCSSSTQSDEWNGRQVKTVEFYECDECGTRFAMSKYLDKHKRTHSSIKKCEICKKVFSTDGYLVAHMRLHTGEDTYKCEVCNIIFIRHAHLISHKRVHTGEKPYKCHICYKDFTQADSLKKHHRIHTGEKPFSCDICFKRFRYKNSLKWHSDNIHKVKKVNL